LLSFAANLPVLGNQTLLSSPQYNAVGMTQAALGNGLTETRSYNNRTWLASLSLSNSVYSLGLTYFGNGNVYTANDSQNGNWTYGYDNVNRLHTASMTGQSFTYAPDTWGNMTCTNSGRLPCTPAGLSFSTGNNQISTSGYTYDQSGNLVTDNMHGYVYDLENRLACMVGTDGTCTSASAVNYLYDAQGQRVGKQQANTLEDYVYDSAGHATSVYQNAALLRAELYSGGRHMATWNANGLFFNHADWLGTERVRTNSSGTGEEWCTDTPYGMNLACNTPDQSPLHFTGKQRDYESNLDFFEARYFGGGNNLGRFMSPDPLGKRAADSQDPQTWNLYAYVRNNPMTFVDPEGESIELTCSSSDADKCAGERQKELQALQQAVGKEAGSYLYENAVTTTDANGNSTTKYYVGIYTNGPSGNGPAFDQINSVAGELAPIINDTKNVQLAIARNGQTLTDDIGNRQTLSGQNPGWTSFFNGNLRAYIVDPSTPLVSVPDLKMFPPVPGVTTPGILVGHELGHARAVMTGSMPGLPTFPSSLRIEDKIRTRDNPNAPIRMTH
jgi:RHS repeat-associated protein